MKVFVMLWYVWMVRVPNQDQAFRIQTWLLDQAFASVQCVQLHFFEHMHILVPQMKAITPKWTNRHSCTLHI